MPAEAPPQLFDVASSQARHIRAGDSVKLAMLRGPDHVLGTSVFLEIWERGGSQPPNSHPRSVETFLFLRGTGTAYCDGTRLSVHAGQLLVLPAGSVHRIESSQAQRLFAITTMAPDDGFAALVGRGEPAPLDEVERAVLAQAALTG